MRAISRYQVEKTKVDFLSRSILPGFEKMCNVALIEDTTLREILLRSIPEKVLRKDIPLYMLIEGQHRYGTGYIYFFIACLIIFFFLDL